MIREAFAEFAKPSVAVDVVVLRTMNTEEDTVNTVPNKQLQVLLVKKHEEDKWHLPGTIVRLGETFSDAINRIIDTSLNLKLEQLYTVDNPLRDDRGHIITTIHTGILNNLSELKITNGYEYAWFWVRGKHEDRKLINIDNMEIVRELQYDHMLIINDSLFQLREKLLTSDIGFQFIDRVFTIKELENTFNAINERYIPGFRRIIQNKIEETGETVVSKAFRPAKQYRKRDNT